LQRILEVQEMRQLNSLRYRWRRLSGHGRRLADKDQRRDKHDPERKGGH